MNTGIMGNDLLGLYRIHVTPMKIVDELRNILIIMNIPKIKPIIRSILKDASDVTKLLRLKESLNLKDIGINKYFYTSICNITY